MLEIERKLEVKKKSTLLSFSSIQRVLLKTEKKQNPLLDK